MNLIIANTPIRQDAEGRFCLNDLHHAAGGEQRHRPSRWLENKQTQALIAEIEKAGIPAIQSKQQLGTYVCRDLVYAYGMWISPDFHLKVIRAYDGMQTPLPGHATINLAIPPVLSLADYRETRSVLNDLQGKLDMLCKRLTEVEIRCKPADIEAMTAARHKVGKRVQFSDASELFEFQLESSA